MALLFVWFPCSVAINKTTLIHVIVMSKVAFLQYIKEKEFKPMYIYHRAQDYNQFVLNHRACCDLKLPPIPLTELHQI